MVQPTNDHSIWIYRLVVIVLIAAGVLFLVLQYTTAQLLQLQRVWQTEWREQEQELLTTLQQPNQDLDVGAVMQPWLERCITTERREYEDVLQRLGTGLSAADLRYLAENFDRCGTIAADQSLGQGMALEREVAKLEQWTEAATFWPELDHEYYRSHIESWEQVVAYTADIQAAQHALDSLQRRLIWERRDGSPVDGEVIQEVLQEVQAAREALSAATVQRREALRDLSL